jgi:hypothetical protein
MNILEAFEELNTINEESILACSSPEAKAIVENDRKELEGLCAKISEYLYIAPQWEKPTIHNNKVFFSLVEEPFEQAVDIDDFDDEDYFDVDGAYARAEEHAKEDGLLVIADVLGVDKEAVKKFPVNSDEMLDIPGSSWKLLSGFDIEMVSKEPEVLVNKVEKGDRWTPSSWEFDFDDSASFQATYYLVKSV